MGEESAPVDDDKLDKKKKHDAESAADLEKVTDFAEEKEVSGTDLASVLVNIEEKKKSEIMKIMEKERELAKVPIKREDVELIIKEMEVSKQIAERTLRENGGNLASALTALVHS